MSFATRAPLTSLAHTNPPSTSVCSTAPSTIEAPLQEEDPARYCPGGYHPVRLDDILTDRYKVKRKLGFGLYSTVWLAEDARTSQHVAVKILTADSLDVDHPVFELEILQRIATADSSHPGYQHVIRLIDSFHHVGPNGTHLCLVFPVMGESIEDLRRRFITRQIPAALMKQIARQILLGLDYIHNSCNVIHTDIKPRNILIDMKDVESIIHKRLSMSVAGANPPRSERIAMVENIHAMTSITVKIVDFGVASWANHHLTEWIQPAALRAPEVILGMKWDHKVDVWSTACMIFELLQGNLFFHGSENQKGGWTAEDDHLAQMIELLGPIPSDWLREGSRSSRFFDEQGQMRRIHQFYPITLEEKINVKRNLDCSTEDTAKFASFLRLMLQYRPGDRADAKTMTRNAWLE